MSRQCLYYKPFHEARYGNCRHSAGRSMTTRYKHSWLGNWVVDKADGYRPTIVFNLCVNQFNLPSRGWALPNCQRYWVAKPGYAECLRSTSRCMTTKPWKRM